MEKKDDLNNINNINNIRVKKEETFFYCKICNSEPILEKILFIKNPLIQYKCFCMLQSNILSIKKFFLYLSRHTSQLKFNLDKLNKCFDHKNMDILAFCLDCKQNICLLCEDKHKAHNYILLIDYVINNNKIIENKEYIEKFYNDIKNQNKEYIKQFKNDEIKYKKYLTIIKNNKKIKKIFKILFNNIEIRFTMNSIKSLNNLFKYKNIFKSINISENKYKIINQNLRINKLNPFINIQIDKFLTVDKIIPLINGGFLILYYNDEKKFSKIQIFNYYNKKYLESDYSNKILDIIEIQNELIILTTDNYETEIIDINYFLKKLESIKLIENLKIIKMCEIKNNNIIMLTEDLIIINYKLDENYEFIETNKFVAFQKNENFFDYNKIFIIDLEEKNYFIIIYNSEINIYNYKCKLIKNIKFNFFSNILEYEKNNIIICGKDECLFIKIENDENITKNVIKNNYNKIINIRKLFNYFILLTDNNELLQIDDENFNKQIDIKIFNEKVYNIFVDNQNFLIINLNNNIKIFNT